jgi:hypothetical protein
MLLNLRTWQVQWVGMPALLVLLVLLGVQAQLSHLMGLTPRQVEEDSAPEWFLPVHPLD